MSAILSREMRPLRDLATHHGVLTSYIGMAGERRYASPEALIAVLRALGVSIEHPRHAPGHLSSARDELARRVINPILLGAPRKALRATIQLPKHARRGRLEVRMALETGEVREESIAIRDLPAARSSRRAPARGADARKLRLDGPWPLGYHQLTITVGGTEHESLLIVAPDECRPISELHAGKRWGAFLPLYSLRKRGDWGVGDYADLRQLLHWMNEHGGEVVGTLPLLASFLEEPCNPSPYAPVSRLFWNELYVDVPKTHEWLHNEAIRNRARSDAHRRELQRLRARKHVDYRAVMGRKRAFLEAMAKACFENDARREALEGFLHRKPEVRDYARFRAACERHGVPWQSWPKRLQEGRLRPQDYDDESYRYHLYAQWVADDQLAAAAREMSGSGRGLYMDLPLGVDRAGYDTWREGEAFLKDLSAGAPPDPLFTKGQDWGLPPLNPHGLRRQGYRYLRKCLHHNLRYAGILRVDHIMGFHRVYCVPQGMEAADGAYVQYPAEEFYAVLALESRKCDCAVVGEDLGTVPEYVRDAMRDRNVNRLYVVQYSLDSEGKDEIAPPKTCVASLNTHDMPTFAGFYRGVDIEDRVDLGLMDEEEALEETKERADLRRHLCHQLRDRGYLPRTRTDVRSVLRGVLRLLAESPAELVLVNLEDLWLEEKPQNVPGTSWERPNWLRKASKRFEQFTTDPEVLRLVHEVNRHRTMKSPT